MSYEIVYERQFVEIEKGIYLPFICSGSNNCTQLSRKTGREIKDRNWSLLIDTHRGVTAKEIYDHCSVKHPDEADECTGIKKGSKFLTRKELEDYIMRSVKRAIPLRDFLERNTLKIRMYGNVFSKEHYFNSGQWVIKKAENYLEQIDEFDEKFALFKEENPVDYKEYFVGVEINDGESKIYRGKKTI